MRGFLVFPIVLAVTSTAALGDILIDSFDTFLEIQDVQPQELFPNPLPVSDFVFDPNILGGERFTQSFNSANVGTLAVNTNAGGNGLLRIEATPEAQGGVFMAYLEPNVMPLGGVDLTDGGTDFGLAIELFSNDVQFDVIYNVFTSNSQFSNGTLSIDNTNSTPTTAFIPFSDFVIGDTATSPLAPSFVQNFQLTIEMREPGGTIEIGSIFTTVPEPSSLGLLVIGALSIRRRNR